MSKQRGTFVVQVDERLCKGTEGCRICISVCPEEVLVPSERMTLKGIHPSKVASLERCTGCELCMLYCPDLAIVVAPCTFTRKTKSLSEKRIAYG